MQALRRYKLLIRVLPLVALFLVIKSGIHAIGLEVIQPGPLIPSLVAGAIFLLGFLLTHVMNHYREAERLPGEFRAALEAIHDDVACFVRLGAPVDMNAVRALLTRTADALEAGLGVAAHHKALEPAESSVDALSALLSDLAHGGMSERFILHLRHEQDSLRRILYRIAYIQRIRSIPSMHVLVETLVIACLSMLLFVGTPGSIESMLIAAFASYLFIFALLLIDQLGLPFRRGEGSADDVDLFLLSELRVKLAAEAANRPTTDLEPVCGPQPASPPRTAASG